MEPEVQSQKTEVARSARPGRPHRLRKAYVDRRESEAKTSKMSKIAKRH